MSLAMFVVFFVRVFWQGFWWLRVFRVCSLLCERSSSWVRGRLLSRIALWMLLWERVSLGVWVCLCYWGISV